MEKVRVFLTDWQILFRAGVHLTLAAEKSYEIIGEAATNEWAFDFIERHQPAVAILNADHGELTGAEITKRVKRNLPSVAVILMMDGYGDEKVFTALKSGASACLSKDVKPDDLLKTVRGVVQGEYPISQWILQPVIASQILNEFEIFEKLRDKMSSLPVCLSSLEAQILQHISSGNSLVEIARKLDISEDIIRQRLYTILGKLVANDRNHQLK